MDDPHGAEALIAALQDPACLGDGAGTVEVVETHISWVLLTRRHAYKIKKPVKLPFLDFSTLDDRRHYCEEELRINRRLAPELYLDVLPIGGTPEAPEPGREPAIEYAVRMRRFPADATLDHALPAGGVSAEAIAQLADLVAAFHADEPPADGSTSIDAALENLDELEDYVPADDAGGLAELRRWTEARCAELAGVLERRRSDGAIREAHGDLHLSNLVLIGDRIVPFDALEFNRELRTIDVMNEVGFLVMDLAAYDRADLGFVFLNRYLERTGDYGGLRVLRFFTVYRALVRAKVYAIAYTQHDEHAAHASMGRYLAAARSLTREERPVLAITCGLSGSGKTTVTDTLIPRLPALRVRSDLERKRLHGLDPGDESGSGIGRDLYGREATDRTYAALEEAADCALHGGFDVIVDASFLSAHRREPFEALAERRGARFCIVEVTARDEVLRRRIRERAARGADPSEADEAVLDYQIERREPLSGSEAARSVRVDTEQPSDPDALAARVRDA